MSVPARVPPARESAPDSVPLADAARWSDGGGDSPALALQRRLAREWSPAFGLPEPSVLAPRLEAAIAATSRIAGPVLLGATLGTIANLLS